MAQIPRYITEAKPVGGVPMPQGNIGAITSTGAAQIGQAVGKLGGVLQEIAVRQYEMKTAADQAKGEDLFYAAYSDTWDERDLDRPETWDTLWQQNLGRAKQQIGKLGVTAKAQRELDNFYTSNTNQFGIRLRAAAGKQLLDNSERAIKDSAFLHYQRGNYEAGDKRLEDLLLGGRPREYIAGLQEHFKNLVEVKQEDAARQAILLQKKNDEQLGNQMLSLLINKRDPDKPQLTFEMIANSSLSLQAKEKWITNLRTFDNYSYEQLQRAFKDDPQVKAEVLDRIRDDTITDEEIRDSALKGLSPETADDFIKNREPWRSHYYGETEQIFKRLFNWTSEFGFPENEGKAGFRYDKVLRDWQNEVKKQKAQGEDIKRIGREIARPEFTKYLHDAGEYDLVDIPSMIDLALGEPDVEIQELLIAKPPKAPEVKEWKVDDEYTDIDNITWKYGDDGIWHELKQPKNSLAKEE